MAIHPVLSANDRHASSINYQQCFTNSLPNIAQESFACMIEAAGFKAVTFENHMAGVVAIHSGFKL